MAALGADCGAEGSGGVKIPDDVFTTRCRYCGHGQTGAENKEIPDDKLFIHFWAKQSPCGIIGIAQCDKVQGECLDFKPNPMFGICEYCTFTNSFHPGFCTAPSGPVNKRRVFLGWSGIGDYYSVHALFTCDRYRVSERWKDLILKNAVEGHAPANFGPGYLGGVGAHRRDADGKTVGGPASQTKGRTGGRGRKRGGKKDRAGAKTNFHV